MVQPLLSDPSLLLLSCNAKKREVLLNWFGPVVNVSLGWGGLGQGPWLTYHRSWPDQESPGQTCQTDSNELGA